MLRDYQQRTIELIKSTMGEGVKKILCTLPTGAGKTVIFLAIAEMVANKGKRVLILTDRTSLLNQTGGRAENSGLNPVLISPKHPEKSNDSLVYVAMSQTLKKRAKKSYYKALLNNIDLLIIDEAHKQEFNELISLVSFVIGFTATPERSGKMRQLGLDYEVLLNPTSVSELIESGYLVGSDTYTVEAPDMSDVSVNRMTGDYNTSQMFKKFNDSRRYSGLIDNLKKIINNEKTLVFCVNIEHALKTTELLTDEGYSVKFISSKISKPKFNETGYEGANVIYQKKLENFAYYNRMYKMFSGPQQDVINEFDKGIFQILVNVDIATTGLDVPSLESVVLYRAILSRPLYLQMVGRGARPYLTKESFILLDFGGNVDRFGYYEQDKNFGLWHMETRGGGVAPVKRCGLVNGQIKGCGRLIHAGLTICPFCGFEYKKKEAKKADLKLVTDERVFKKISSMDITELVEYWKIKKHKTPWLWRQLTYKGGLHAIDEAAKQFNWSTGTTNRAKKYALKILRK